MATKEATGTNEPQTQPGETEAVAAAAMGDMTRDQERITKAQGIVKNYMIGSAAAGFIPVPIADMTVIALIQLKMLHSLANLYEVKFTSELGKSVIASLTGGIAAASVGRGTLTSLAKAIPIIGQAAAAATLPVISGASTYAVGQVFIQHFESGGTFLDFDPEKMKQYFAEQYEKGKLVVADLKKA